MGSNHYINLLEIVKIRYQPKTNIFPLFKFAKYMYKIWIFHWKCILLECLQKMIFDITIEEKAWVREDAIENMIVYFCNFKKKS